MCLAQGPQPSDAGYRLEPATSRSRVKHSTTEPLRSLNILCEFNLSINLKSDFFLRQKWMNLMEYSE